MIFKKNLIYLAIFSFIFLFLAFSYERSDSVLKRLDLETITSKQQGVYKGNIAEDFQLLNSVGEKVSLSDFRGKKVIINFFATWCSPCQEEMPTLVQLDKKIDDEKLVLLGINVTKEERNVDDVRRFLNHFEVKYEVLFDGDGKVMKDYQLIGIPTTIFIDENGKIVERLNGIVTMEMLLDHPFLQGLLNKNNQ
ncbi:hypothetical protein BKP45_13060 [Anaerobacillus alkalidiazotrophicus]|uniref:Thioredoxin domain-containing protein n=1 Tax=Anaerobacillus alkalidiazotrophicus TaxID=472963 RepID=A0A1S2M1A7_9BACI|nr:TlpA family protein disulfide reductase [Anaerobacillus alkalidiazotrophicus]OIJ18491.1 hypothetical protein BKP45_18775 [Anaerobacillus alkalidiazotrophicus]OIJ19970.1 hypothetical protein BKP45_13060 [Anaerobacillus alkalidiazotrophicus]